MSSEPHEPQTHLHAVDTVPTPPTIPPDDHTPPPARADDEHASPSPWSTIGAADESDGAYRRSVCLTFLILALVTTADLFLIKGTFDRVLVQDERVSWALGAALTLISVTLAFKAGVSIRHAMSTPKGSRAHTILTVALVTGWVAIGMGFFWLRWNAATFAPAASSFENASPTSAAGLNESTDRTFAIVMATVYLATGVLALADGFKLTNPVASSMRAVRRSIKMLTAEVCAKEGRVGHLRENLAIHMHTLDTIDDDRDTALAGRRALAEELKNLARVQIAMHLGSPAATGLVRPADDDAAL